MEDEDNCFICGERLEYDRCVDCDRENELEQDEEE